MGAQTALAKILSGFPRLLCGANKNKCVNTIKNRPKSCQSSQHDPPKTLKNQSIVYNHEATNISDYE